MTLVKTLVLATAIALPATAGVAQSTEHLVRVEQNGFFPQPVYVKPGDTIRFVNAAPNWVRVWSEDPNDNFPQDNNPGTYDFNNPCDLNDPDGDGLPEFAGARDGFNTPWFNIGDERVITVTPCIETRFYAPEVWEFNFDSSLRYELIVFGEAPLGF